MRWADTFNSRCGRVLYRILFKEDLVVVLVLKSPEAKKNFITNPEAASITGTASGFLIGRHGIYWQTTGLTLKASVQ